jgi:hypothetical protein
MQSAIAILLQRAQGTLYIGQKLTKKRFSIPAHAPVRDALSGVEPVIPAFLAAQFSKYGRRAGRTVRCRLASSAARRFIRSWFLILLLTCLCLNKTA